MRPLETALHGVTLACCLGLGAGMWQLSRREPPAPPPVPPAAPAPDPRLEIELKKVSGELASLKQEVTALRSERDTLQAQLAQVRADLPAPGTVPAAAFQAALDTPEVRKKIGEVVEARLEVQREADQKDRQERWKEGAQRWMDQRVSEMAQKLGLNDAQKEPLGKLMNEIREHVEQLREQVRKKELTPEQAKADLERTYAEADAKAQAFLAPDQFKQLQEMEQPMRDLGLRSVVSPMGPLDFFGGLGGGGRRQRPAP